MSGEVYPAMLKLQDSIARNTDFKSADIKNALMANPETPENFATFRLALVSKKIDPTELFRIVSILAIEVDPIYVRHVGLALRYGANPNSYVLAEFDFDGEMTQVPIHVAKRIWDITPRTLQESIQADYITFGDLDESASNEFYQMRFEQKQRTCLDILSMMALQGFLSDAQVSNAQLLTNMGINATRFANMHPEFFSSVYGEIKGDDSLGFIVADEIKYFEEWKGSMQNAYGVNRDRDSRILKYALLLDNINVLTLTDSYGVSDTLRLMFYFQDNNSIKLIMPKLKDLKIIGYGDKDSTSTARKTELMMFDWCITYYNRVGIDQLLELGIVPDYGTRTQTILAAKKICPSYPLQCKVLNGMTIAYVKYGYGLDSEQMFELNFSPTTLEAVKKEYTTTSWQYRCRIRSGDVEPDLKDIARGVGIPVGSSKDQICSTLEDMSKANPSSLKSAVHDVNKNRIKVMTTTAADVVSGRKLLSETRTLPSTGNMTIDELQQLSKTSTLKKSSTSKSTISKSNISPSTALPESPICTNDDTLMRPIEDYPDIYRVSYSDGQHTWCFTSENFEDLIRSGKNRWAVDSKGEPADIPVEVIYEMKDKLQLIRIDGGLESNPQSISEGVDRLFKSDSKLVENVYEADSNRRLQEFYEFSEVYEIPRETYINFTANDFQLLSDAILSPETRIVVDDESPGLALRDFASAVLDEGDRLDNFDELGRALNSLLTEFSSQ